MAVSLRLPEEVKKQVEKLARERDTTPHAFMLEAIREKVEAEDARQAFLTEAHKRLARMKEAGTGIPSDEVFDYLQKRAAGHKPARPRARKIR